MTTHTLVVRFADGDPVASYSADTPGHWQYAGDYAQIAEGMGGYAERVEHPDEVISAIKRALQAMRTGKPALLDVITKLEWSSQTSGPQLN